MPVLRYAKCDWREKDAFAAIRAFRISSAMGSTAQDFYLMVTEGTQSCDLYGAGISFL